MVGAVPVADRAWVCPSRFRPDLEDALAVEQTRAAACCDRIDVQLRGLDCDACDMTYHVKVSSRLPWHELS